MTGTPNSSFQDRIRIGRGNLPDFGVDRLVSRLLGNPLTIES